MSRCLGSSPTTATQEVSPPYVTVAGPGAEGEEPGVLHAVAGDEHPAVSKLQQRAVRPLGDQHPQFARGRIHFIGGFRDDRHGR